VRSVADNVRRTHSGALSVPKIDKFMPSIAQVKVQRDKNTGELGEA
jgi:hypothetical protein